jgi:UDP-glucose 4-epimerase
MNKVLVTGGAGFIGTSLVEALTQLENEIIIYDNLSTATKGNNSGFPGSPNLTLVHADMLDQSSLRKAVDLCEVVFHLAANSEVRVGTTDTRIDYEQNVLATYNLLEAVRNSTKCKKIVFTSSSAIYGDAQVVPTSEKYAPLKPISLYGASKLACEAIISGYCHMFNISGIVVRLANVVGPLSTHGVIYDFITKLVANPKYLEILGDGKQNKSYLYIADSINALIEAAKIEKTFEVVNAGSKDNIEVAEIAEIVIRELSLENVILRFNGGIEGRGWKGDVKEMLIDSSKLEAFGWNVAYNSMEAVILAARGMISKNAKFKHRKEADSMNNS